MLSSSLGTIKSLSSFFFLRIWNRGFAPWKLLSSAKSTVKQQTLQTNDARLFDQAMRA